MGEDVLYSGTVAAAIEATMLGVPAVAFSYVGREPSEVEGWQGVLKTLLEQIVSKGMPEDTLLSVNLPSIPPDQVKGVRTTSLGRRRYSDSVTRSLDPSGREYFWIGGGVTSWEGRDDSDFRAIEEGFISVTPLHLDMTSYPQMREVGSWGLTL